MLLLWYSASAVSNKLRILVVDDQHPVLLTYQLILRQQGHEVVGASSCDCAVRHLDESDFDVLLCDLGLDAGRSGFEVIDFAQRRNPRITPFLLTGYGTEEVADAARQRGVNILYKPIEVPDLLNTLRTLAGTRGAA